MASNNSSKTAHVMNLLSKNRSEPAPEEAPKEAAPAQEAAPVQQTAPAAPTAPLLTSINEDAAVSSQIKDALEAELSGEAPAKKPTQEAPAEEPAPETLTAETATAAALESQAPAAEEAQKAAETSQAIFAAHAAVHDENCYVNVMHILVDEKADKYMKMFGLCCCDRCKADVRAYALNHLPPKYVFMGKNEMVPRLTVYESKFSSDIVAQLLNACRVVMETPHHAR